MTNKDDSTVASLTSNAFASTSSSITSLYKTTILLNCGMASGLVQAFIFNPWDRALYLSVKMERPFLHRENFHEPMNGVAQTVVQRALSAGLYFPLEEIFSDLLHAHSTPSPAMNSFAAGTLAGVINGVVMNPFCRVKVSANNPLLTSYC